MDQDEQIFDDGDDFEQELEKEKDRTRTVEKTLPKKRVSETKPNPKKRKREESEDQKEADDEDMAYSAPSLSHIKDKTQRREMYAELKRQKNEQKRKRREKRRKIAEKLGDEVKQDEDVDEFAEYFTGNKTPKILITTSPGINRRAHDTHDFITDLCSIIPNMVYRKRKNFTLPEIVTFCKEKDFTDIIVVNEDRKVPNSIMISHLPNGPTARFRLTSFHKHKDIHNHANATEHYPEVILNNFSTRLGHTVGRMLGALVPQKPEFEGRRVVTWHNQRDFVFFRHHRYIFDASDKVRLQEIGPRFTLKLKWVQHGTFDEKFREYEWVQKPEQLLRGPNEAPVGRPANATGQGPPRNEAIQCTLTNSYDDRKCTNKQPSFANLSTEIMQTSTLPNKVIIWPPR